jgi:hypothetical protein
VPIDGHVHENFRRNWHEQIFTNQFQKFTQALLNHRVRSIITNRALYSSMYISWEFRCKDHTNAAVLKNKFSSVSLLATTPRNWCTQMKYEQKQRFNRISKQTLTSSLLVEARRILHINLLQVLTYKPYSSTSGPWLIYSMHHQPKHKFIGQYLTTLSCCAFISKKNAAVFV